MRSEIAWDSSESLAEVVEGGDVEWFHTFRGQFGNGLGSEFWGEGEIDFSQIIVAGVSASHRKTKLPNQTGVFFHNILPDCGKYFLQCPISKSLQGYLE